MSYVANYDFGIKNLVGFDGKEGNGVQKLFCDCK